MTKKSIFEQVGGLDETFKVAFNDIDYCMKVRRENYLVVYNPYVELYHYESKSRGSDNKKDKNALRYEEESNKFKERYKVELQNGDPYYNKNFSLLHSDFTVNWKKAE